MRITLNEHTYTIDDKEFMSFVESKGKRVELSPEVAEALCPASEADVRAVVAPEFHALAPTIMQQLNAFLEKRKAKILEGMK